MASKYFRNEIDLFYDKETGTIDSYIKYGCNRNAIVNIPISTIWIIQRVNQDYYMISNNGLRVELNDKTSDWFGGLI